MKRFYNKYGACPDDGAAREIRNLLNDTCEQIWTIMDIYEYCPRDTEALCHNNISAWFAEKILLRAYEMKKEEKKLSS